jgi:YidC/Oxa1 family membrane protein insertase
MKNKISLVLAGVLLFSSSVFAQHEAAPKPSAAQSESASLNGAKIAAPATTNAETLSKLELPHSEVQLGEGAFWIHKWTSTQYPDADLKKITSFDQGLLMTFSGSDYAYLNQQKASSFKSIGPSQYEWSYSDANLDYKRTYDVSGEAISVNVSIQFKQKTPEKAFLNIVSQGMKDDPESRDREIFYYTENKIERKNVDKGIDNAEVFTPVRWVGAGSRHFVFTVIPDATTPAEKILLNSTGQYSGQASMQFPVLNKSINTKFKIVFGPKQLDFLRTIDKTLDTTVNLGFFTFIAYPILWALKFIYKYVGNYGLAIIILTIFIKALTFPLVLKSMKGMRKMAEFQPKMKALQEKHKDNKVALNQEMMVLMKSSGYNPMAGCLPMLIQMPIFFALYSVLYAAVELYRSPFVFWIHDLSLRDPYYITPVLMAIIMFLQQVVTPPSPGMDPSQRKIMMFMPLIFGLFMINIASGLCVYMLVNATISIIQQQYLNKKLGLPGAAGMAASF